MWRVIAKGLLIFGLPMFLLGILVAFFFPAKSRVNSKLKGDKSPWIYENGEVKARPKAEEKKAA